MRGEFLYNLLSIIQEAAESNADFLTAFLSSGHSSRQFHKKLYELARQRRWQKYFRSNTEDNFKKELRKYRLLSYKLRRQGFIAEHRDNHSYSLTTAGKQKLQALTNFMQDNIPSTYSKTPSRDLMIVIFDIPEYERRKRAWLRSALKNLGFKMVQKSVWKGNALLPRAFLEDMQKLQLARYIEIFKVTQYGTLE